MTHLRDCRKGRWLTFWRLQEEGRPNAAPGGGGSYTAAHPKPRSDCQGVSRRNLFCAQSRGKGARSSPTASEVHSRIALAQDKLQLLLERGLQRLASDAEGAP